MSEAATPSHGGDQELFGPPGTGRLEKCLMIGLITLVCFAFWGGLTWLMVNGYQKHREKDRTRADRVRRFTQHGVQATATVRQVTPVGVAYAGQKSTVHATEYDCEVEFSGQVGVVRSIRSRSVGSRVDVVYLPDEPGQVVLRSWLDQQTRPKGFWDLPPPLILLLLLLPIAGGAWLYDWLRSASSQTRETRSPDN